MQSAGLVNRLRSRWLNLSPTVRTVLVLFAVARVITVFVAWVIMAVHPDLGFTEVLTDWDGNWNEMVANDLYSPLGAGWVSPHMKLAFFPVLPVTVHVLHLITGVGVHVIGPVVSMALACAAFVVLARYLAHKVGDDVAVVACTLMLFSPNAFVLSMFYTEGLFLLLATLTLQSLDDRRWVRAGLLALLAGLSRPTGFVLFVPCLVAAIVELRRDGGTRRAVVAPLLAPLGFLAWLAYVAHTTGAIGGYFTIQRVAWSAQIDGGAAFVRGVGDLIQLGDHNLDVKLSVLAVLLLGVGGVWLAVRQRMNPVWIAFAAALTIVTAINERQASGWRFLLPAFPLFVAWARAIPRRYQSMVVATSAVVMGAMFYVSIAEQVYTP